MTRTYKKQFKVPRQVGCTVRDMGHMAISLLWEYAAACLEAARCQGPHYPKGAPSFSLQTGTGRERQQTSLLAPGLRTQVSGSVTTAGGQNSRWWCSWETPEAAVLTSCCSHALAHSDFNAVFTVLVV